MKTKYLLSMLLGGTMLAACSMDDDLTTAKVAQDVNPSAPVFNVSFEGDDNSLTRAEYTNEKVSIQKNDIMSLYHGMEVPTTGELPGLTGYSNAIYKATTADDDESSVLTFTTGSMIDEGYAIMIYPADTTFAWKNVWTGAPMVEVPCEQEPETKEYTPYFSEILKINPYNDEKNGYPSENSEAGYDRQYDVTLRRAASTLKFELSPTGGDLLNGKGVDPIKIDKIELNNEDGTGKFTTKVPVKATTTTVTAKTAEKHTSWAYSSALDVNKIDGANQSAFISTKDIDEATNIATFTLLPIKNADKQTYENGFEDTKVIVYTTYGKVTITADDKELLTNPGSDKEENPTLSIGGFLNRLMPMVIQEGKDGTTFKGEEVGVYFKSAVKLPIDLSDVDMDGMHIESSKDLRTALKVYKALGIAEKEGTVTFYLDGNESGEFVIEYDTEMETLLAQVDNKKLMLKPCDYSEENNYPDCKTKTACTKITLDSEDATKEVPGLKLAGAVPVQLNGAWTYTESEGVKEFVKVTKLVVLSTGTLALDGTISADVDEDCAENFVIENRGTISVAGRAILKVNVENYKDIQIGDEDNEGKAELYVGGDTKLTNNAADVNSNKDWADYWKESGTITNYGALGSVTEVGETYAGEINNYGVIYVKSEKAVTYVTRNADVESESENGPADVEKAYSAANRVGSIILWENTGSDHNTVVGNKKAQGFIKLYLVSGAVNTSAVGTVANYIVVQKGITGDINDITTGTDVKVKYLEVEKDVNVKIYRNTFEAILINDGATITVPDNVTLTLNKALYLKGTVRYSGTLAGGKWGLYESIFGTSDGLLVNTGSGKIVE